MLVGAVGIEPRAGIENTQVKLLILCDAKDAKNAQIAELGYTAGTRKS